jgi:DNA-binding NarL/FixJ family response regulator
VIDSHPLVRLGIRGTLEDGFVIHESPTREEALDLVRDVGAFDVAIIDMRYRGSGDGSAINGPDAIRMLQRTNPGLAIVAHGELPERHLASAALQNPSSTRRCRRKEAAAS